MKRTGWWAPFQKARDRAGRPYEKDRLGNVVSPSRQIKKSLGLSGRQAVKLRRRLRREAKAQALAAKAAA
jgi:hypothetical protein